VASSRIAPLLPAEGSSVCFAGDFDGTQALIVGWPHQTRGFVRVTRPALGLDHPRDQTPYPGRGSRHRFDWRYAFTLLMRTSEREDFRADGNAIGRSSVASLIAMAAAFSLRVVPRASLVGFVGAEQPAQNGCVRRRQPGSESRRQREIIHP
jgi:hypothetical protein